MTNKKQITKKLNKFETAESILKRPFTRIYNSSKQYIKRRPHRSFRLTRRRDYKRSLQLEGYFAFSSYVNKTLWQHRRIFIWLVVCYAALSAILVGIASQDVYNTLTESVNQTGDNIFSGSWGEIGKASLLFITTITGDSSNSLSASQQIYAGLIFLLTWLTTVWLLRNLLVGHNVKLRDGLYNASSPLISTFLVAFTLIVQLLPLALALIGYAAAQSSGLLSGGVEAMLFWFAAGLLALLSLYWISGTFIALVVVTLPGMYPFNALRIAGDLVIGRRIRILLRLLWMILGVGLMWAVILIPVIMIDSWMKSLWTEISWLPTVPFATLLMSSLAIVWSSSYIYLLYRKVVDDDASPA